MNDDKNGNRPNELEKFIEENKEFFDRWERIGEAVEEEMAEIARYKAAHPETYDLEHQLEVTNRFLEENPDLTRVELDVKHDEED